MLMDTKLSSSLGHDCMKELIANEQTKLHSFETEMHQIVESMSLLDSKSSFYLFGTSPFKQASKSLEDRLKFLSQEIDSCNKKIYEWNQKMNAFKKNIKLSEK